MKIRFASADTFESPNFGLLFVAGPITAWPMTRLSSTSIAMPDSAAHIRWPRMVSMIESAALIPTIMSTNRNSISTAPV